MATQGPKSPTVAQSIAGSQVGAWTNANNIFTSNDQRATVSFAGLLGITLGGMPWLAASGFGFNIPADATIQGITTTIECRQTGGLIGNSSLPDVQLTKVAATPIGMNKGTTVALTNSDVVRTYGGPADLWGLQFTPAEINSPGFGFAVRATATDVLGNRSVEIDHMSITVTYKVETKVDSDLLTETISLKTPTTNEKRVESSPTLVEKETLFTPNANERIVERISPTSEHEMVMEAPVVKQRFILPSKTEVIADGEDVAMWENLPIPTHFYCTVHNDIPEQNPNEWDVEDGWFGATFYPWGEYRFILSADGFEDLHITITAIPMEGDSPGDEE